MADVKKILFLFNSDYGQANVNLSTIYSLTQTLTEAGTTAELHVGTFENLKPMFDDMVELIKDDLHVAPNISFHPIVGTSQFEAMKRPELGVFETFHLPLPSYENTSQFLRQFPTSAIPWEDHELCSLYDQIKTIIQQVQPDLTVIDPLLVPATTLAKQLNLKWTVLAPNTMKDFCILQQPWLAGMWKYPIIGSGLAYPVPWSQIPLNISLNFVLAWATMKSGRVAAARDALRKRSGDATLDVVTISELGVVQAPPPGVRIMTAISKELDYPMSKVPDWIVPLGPIVKPYRPLADVDFKLAQWLSRGPTVYVNFGTQLAIKASEALELAHTLRNLLDAAETLNYGGKRKMQILWKIKTGKSRRGSEIDWTGDWAAVRDVLLPEIKDDRVRVTTWIDANPNSILQSGHVVCSVHHGGANSWAEATIAGVPQAIATSWIDCHDFGNRVELAKTGIWANKKSLPRWERLELGEALRALILGPEAEGYQENARRVAERHPANAGRDKAAQMILTELNKA